MANRELTSDVLTALEQRTIRPALFYEGEFVASGSPSETPAYLRLWTGVGDIVWDGKTWTGGGRLLGISPIEETREIQAKGFSVQLSGMPTEIISVALRSVRQGRPGTLWIGFFDSSNQLIADPAQLQSGKFDISIIEDDGETCTISAQYESRLIDLEKPRKLYYTSEDQQIAHPGDLGFEYVPSLQDAEIEWG